MISSTRTDFAQICRDLRISHGYKHREVAAGVGIATTTSANLESSKWMVVAESRARRIAEFYQLDSAAAAALLEAWRRLPVHPDSEKRRKFYDRRNRMRSKARHHDRLMRSLAEIMGLLLPAYVERFGAARVCACSFDRDDACEVCMALENLGLQPWTDLPRVTADLCRLQEKLAEAGGGEQSENE